MRTRPSSRALEHASTRARFSDLRDLVAGLAGLPAASSSIDRGDVQEVLAGELLLRIVRRVAVRLDAEPPLDDRRIAAEQRVDLVVAPQIERAFRLVGVGSSACSGGTLSASSAE